MSISVSSWFIDQLNSASSSPKRTFSVGGSDYTSRVVKFPTVKRTAYDIRVSDVSISLANDDGHFNFFYANVYTTQKSANLQMGFTHSTSGDELIPVFTGYLKKVSYSKTACSLTFQDKMWSFSERQIADEDNPVTFTGIIPSDIAWTLCTCYGGLSNIASTSNADLDYDSFLAWASVFSRDNIVCTARYEEEKVKQALSNLAKMTDSAIWTEGDGKIRFKRFVEADSKDLVLSEDEIVELSIDIEDLRLINKQYVYGNYVVNSEMWGLKVYDINSSSVESYSLREDTMKDKTIWYTSSATAINMAQRQISLYSDIPRRFNIDIPLIGIYQQVADTVRITDSFLSITSDSAWRIMEWKLNMDNGSVACEIDGAAVLEPFYLDIDILDGTKVLI